MRAQRSLARSFLGRLPSETVSRPPLTPQLPWKSSSMSSMPAAVFMGLPSPYIWTPDFHKCWQSLRSVSHGRATSLAGNQKPLAGKPGLLDRELVWLLHETLEQVCATSTCKHLTSGISGHVSRPLRCVNLEGTIYTHSGSSA